MQKIYSEYDKLPDNGELFTLRIISEKDLHDKCLYLSILKEVYFNRGKNLQIFRPTSYEDLYDWNNSVEPEFPNCQITDCCFIDLSDLKKTWKPEPDIVHKLITWMHEREIWTIGETIFNDDNFIDLINQQNECFFFFGPIRIGREIIEDLLDYLNIVFYKYIFTFDPYSYFSDGLYDKGYCVKIKQRPNSEKLWDEI